MELTPSAAKRLGYILAANSKHPQHSFLESAQPGYTYVHANTFPIAQKSLQGPLPPSLNISNLLLSSLVEGINPAEENWANRRAHVFQKGGVYDVHFGRFLNCFKEVATNCIDAIQTILEEFSDEDWPFTQSKQSMESLLANVEDLLQQQTRDNHTAYVNLPFLLPLTLDMLLRLDHWIDTNWAQAEIEKFHLYLTYPVATPSSYNLNLYYSYDHSEGVKYSTPLELMAGYRLGWARTGQDRNGRSGTAIKLEKISITTLHWKRHEAVEARPGFICEPLLV